MPLQIFAAKNDKTGGNCEVRLVWLSSISRISRVPSRKLFRMVSCPQQEERISALSLGRSTPDWMNRAKATPRDAEGRKQRLQPHEESFTCPLLRPFTTCQLLHLHLTQNDQTRQLQNQEHHRSLAGVFLILQFLQNLTCMVSAILHHKH